MQKRDSIYVSILLSNTRILRGVSKIRECYSMGHLSSFAVVPIERCSQMRVSEIRFKAGAKTCVLMSTLKL